MNGFVTPNRLKVCEFIGSGSFGTIASCYICSNFQNLLAVKRCKDILKPKKSKSTENNCIFVKRMFKEIEILTFFRDYNLGRFFTSIKGGYIDQDDVYIAMKKEDQALVSLDTGSLSTFAKKMILYDIAKSLVVLNKLGIVHRDIKMSNILVSKDGPFYKAKLCDFGLSDAEQLTKTDKYPVVSAWYRPFELFYPTKVNCFGGIDVWSYGCIVYEVMQNDVLFRCDEYNNTDQMVKTIMSVIGTPFFKNDKLTDYYQSLNTMKKNDKMKNVNPKTEDLVSKCLVYNYNHRIDPGDIIMHDFFDLVRSKESAKMFIEKCKSFPRFRSGHCKFWSFEKTVLKIKELVENL